MSYKKLIKWVVVFIFILLVAILYKKYNPLGNNFFPKCPFKLITGYKCPGCGSQRAIHYLLNFDIKSAFAENAILVISIPYVMVGFIFDLKDSLSEKALKWKKRLFGTKAIYIALLIITSFWVLRNTVFTNL